MFQGIIKTAFAFSTILVIIFTSCNSSTQKKNPHATQNIDSNYIILPNPNDSLILYYNEDMAYATEKIVHAYHLKDSPRKVEEWNNSINRDYIVGYHNCFTVANDSITAEYHIICSFDKYYNRRDNWFGYLSIVLTSSKNNAFEVLQTITNDIDNSYKNSKNYSWDEEKGQWTNGMQYVYVQPTSRDEETGIVCCAICIMPIDLVH